MRTCSISSTMGPGIKVIFRTYDDLIFSYIYFKTVGAIELNEIPTEMKMMQE